MAKVTHKGKRVRLDDGREYNHRAELVGRSKWSSQRLIPVDEARKHGSPLPAEKKAELLAMVERL